MSRLVIITEYTCASCARRWTHPTFSHIANEKPGFEFPPEHEFTQKMYNNGGPLYYLSRKETAHICPFCSIQADTPTYIPKPIDTFQPRKHAAKPADTSLNDLLGVNLDE